MRTCREGYMSQPSNQYVNRKIQQVKSFRYLKIKTELNVRVLEEITELKEWR